MFRVAIAQLERPTTRRTPPLAAGRLAATLRQEAGAELAGIPLYMWNRRGALEVARWARASCPELRVVAGGPPAPRRPEAAAFLAVHPRINVAQMGSRPRPEPRRTAVRAIRWPHAVERAARRDAFIAPGRAEQPRGLIERLP